MAVTSKLFGQANLKACNKEIDWDSDTIKVKLYTGAITLATVQDSWVYEADIETLAEVANGSGYTTGGITLANKTIGYTSGTNVIKRDADDAIWSSASITATYAIIIDTQSANTATNPLIGIVDFGGSKVSSSGNFTIAWDSAGIFTDTSA